MLFRLKIASVPVGDCLRGRVVDALGNAIDGGAPIKAQAIYQTAALQITRLADYAAAQTL